MKTKSIPVRLLLAAAILGGFASLVFAGPGPQYWVRPKPVTTFTEAKAVGQEDVVTMQCKGCKTVLVRDTKHIGPSGKGYDTWFTVGSKHFCEECKGEITVVKGKTEDSMQHNCDKCGEGAVTCCAASSEKKMKP